MFNVGTGELMVILLIALLVLGPDKLPDAARKIGNVMAEVRRMSTGFQAEMRSAMEEATRTPLEPVKDPPETPVATAEAPDTQKRESRARGAPRGAPVPSKACSTTSSVVFPFGYVITLVHATRNEPSLCTAVATP